MHKIKLNKDAYAFLLIIFISIIFFLPYLGEVHLFDWDEINFAEAAREMIVTGDYLTVRIDYKPFHEKPPLFFWMQVVSMKIFGINEFAARLPNAVTGMITLLLLYVFGKKIFDDKFGLLWVISYLGSFLPHFYFKTGIIDPVFNLFIFLSICFIHFHFQRIASNYSRRYLNIFLSGIFAGLAVLTKGPVACLLVILTILFYWFFNRKAITFPFKEILVITLLGFVFYIAWYLATSILRGADIISDFLRYHIRLLTTEDAGHGGPFYYHFVVLLLGCFPASVLAIRSFRKYESDSMQQRAFKQWMIILLCIVLIIFSIVETKIIHYSSLCYFPITFLSAYAIYSITFRKMQWKISTSWIASIIGAFWAIALAIIPLIFMNLDMILPRVTDQFTYSLLQSEVDWQGWEYFLGIIYFIVIVVTIVYWQKGLFLKGFLIIFTTTALTVFTFLPLIVPKIEQYSQRAPIEFFKQLKDKDIYLASLGYKSYAQYFYSDKKEHLSAYSFGVSQPVFNEWLLSGKIDKDAYFVCKNKHIERYLHYKNMEILYEKSGYVFLLRKAD